VQQSVDRAFTDLLESAPEAVVCVDHQDRIAGVNAGAEKLFDYARADLAGQPIEILIPGAAGSPPRPPRGWRPSSSPRTTP
jgi:protein-histidine pros-kinase